MKIAINLIPFSTIQGTEIFSGNLISNLLKLNTDDEFFILGSGNMPELLKFPEMKMIKINGLKVKYSKALYQQTLIYPLLKKYKIDLLFSPSPAAPFFYKNKIVVIHDCAYDRFPEFENILSKMYFKLMFYGAKYFSKKIVTDSYFSKKELTDLYKIKPEKIEVIYGGVPEMPEVEDDFVEKTLKKFKIDKPYFLYIGNWRPRKNLIGLMDAFQIFSENYKDFLLVIAGRKDKRFIDLEKEAQKRRKLSEKIILTGFISQKEKVALYKKAVALTFPSFYEGFGLPVLEAQSLGIPVLTSKVSSLPEVAGEGALYVNPYNIEEIAQGMIKIAFNKQLREILIQKGYQNIKRFSWERSAKKLLKIFHENSSSK